MTDRPTSITLPLRWEKISEEDFDLWVGPVKAGAVYVVGSVGEWRASSRNLFDYRDNFHTAEAAQIALERALVKAVGEGG